LEIHRGLIKAESKAAAQESLGVSVDQIYKAPNKPKQEFSEKLMLKLTSHRTAAMQVAMLNNHHVALVAVTHTLLCQEFRDYTDPYDLSSVKVSGTSSRHHISSKADDMEQSRAWAELEAKRAALKARLPDSLNEYFGWLLALETPELLEILAFLTANCLDVTSGDSTEHPSTDLFAALDVNMADWWTPTVGSYLSNVPKVKVIEAVSESIGAMATAGMEKMKKDELLACAERKLEGRGWLPGPLRS